MAPATDVSVEGEAIDNSITHQTPSKKPLNIPLLVVYIIFLAISVIGGPLVSRLYYTEGGTLKWLQSWILSAGFVASIPIIILILVFKSRSSSTSSSDRSFMDLRLFIYCAGLGILFGLNNYMYTTGLAYLPVSTSSLLFATQLAFTAIFAFLIVRHKFTFYTFNSVVVMTLGAVVLALNTSGDRPPGVTQGKYLLGFFLTLGGAAMWGVTSPLIELAFSKSNITFSILLQTQVVMNLFATLFSTVGLLASGEYKDIAEEGRQFGMGEVKYYVIMVSSALIWQLSTIGVMGVIHLTNSLFNGILSSVLLPMTQIGGVVAFQEKFTAEKGLSLALCLWGFASYFLGEYRKSRKPKPLVEHVNGVQDPRKTDLELTNQAAHQV